MVILSFILVFMGIVVVHEFGHYIFAKMFGVRVLEFSIGFGPAIYKKKGKETTFRINIFPLGGYVRLSGENPEDFEEGDEGRRFYDKPAWQRLLIALAGPVFSVLAGYVLFMIIVSVWGVNLAGVSTVLENTPAQRAGLLPGDRILKVNGKYVFDPMVISSIIKEGKEINLVVLRNGKEVSLSINPEMIPEQWDFYLKSAEGTPEGKFVSLENQQKITPEFVKTLINERVRLTFDGGYIEGVLQNFSYAPKKYAVGFVYAGYKPVFKKDTPPFKRGDRIISIDGIKLKNWLWFIRATTYLALEDKDAYIELYGKDIDWYTYGPSDVVDITYESGGKIKTVSLSKEKAQKILSDLTLFTPEVAPYKPHSKTEAINLAVERCNWVVLLTWKNLFGASLFKNISSGQVVGPVGLVQMVGTASKMGLDSVLVLVAIITMSIGIFNLLPLPALDGGRIVFALFEMITRKEVNPRVEAIIHTIGFIFLLGLMIYISFMDVGRMMGR